MSPVESRFSAIYGDPMVLDELLPAGVLIGGEFRPTASRFDDVDPSTGEVFASAPDGSVVDMQAAVAAARRSFDDGEWARRSPADRAKALVQLAEVVERRADDIAALGAIEWGMTANERYVQVDVGNFHVSDAADNMAEALADEDLGKPDWGISCQGMRAPVGVVAAITPWNFPHTINLQKLAPALAAGNSLVLKPSPLSPLVALVLARLVAEETDIPPGVVNVVPTTSQEAAEVLTTDPRVDMVTFVGSAATARHVGAAAAQTMKRSLFELGGKSAAIFLDDYDVDRITDQTVQDSCAMHAGQACILHSRLLVHERIYDDFVNRFVDQVADVVVGPASDPASTMGPLINAEARERVLAMIGRAVDGGARLLAGGSRPAGLDGFFVEPTVLADVDNSTEIAQDEVFGPVTCIIRVTDDDDAIRTANDSQYGLVGTVFSADRERALRVARQVDAGVVTIDGAPPFGPFGGWKQSGIGREGGVWGIRSYTELRSVTAFG
jgi:acyl-CoA reductase-like NAD-dependent aldehyde dehydrogenase